MMAVSRLPKVAIRAGGSREACSLPMACPFAIGRAFCLADATHRLMPSLPQSVRTPR